MMIKNGFRRIEIGDKPYDLPTSKVKIPIDVGIQCLGLLKGNEDSHQVKRTIIRMMIGIEIGIISRLSIKDINRIWKYLPFDNPEEGTDWFFPIFKLGKTIYGIQKSEKITVREWAQIERYYHLGETPYSYLPEMMATLCRPISYRNNNLAGILINKGQSIRKSGWIPLIFKDYEIETLERDDKPFEERAKIFRDNLKLSTGLGFKKHIDYFFLNTQQKFPSLFKRIEKDDFDEMLEEQGLPAGEEDTSFEAVWGIYHIVSLISGSKSEREDWWESKLTEFYTYVSYYQEYNKVLENRNNG